MYRCVGMFMCVCMHVSCICVHTCTFVCVLVPQVCVHMCVHARAYAQGRWRVFFSLSLFRDRTTHLVLTNTVRLAGQ